MNETLMQAAVALLLLWTAAQQTRLTRLKKSVKEIQAESEETRRKFLSNMTALAKTAVRMQLTLDRQEGLLRKTEQTITQRLQPLAESSRVINDLKTKLKAAEENSKNLKVTVLQTLKSIKGNQNSSSAGRTQGKTQIK